jgi:hypothetical protein
MGRLLLFALVCAACASPKEPDRERVVTPRRGVGAEAAPSPRFENELAEIDRLRAEGDLKTAAERTERALRARPPEPYLGELRERKRALLEDSLALPTLQGEVVPERERLAFGDPVRVRVRLRNVSGRPARVPARWWLSSGAVFQFDIERRDLDVRGQRVLDRSRSYVPLGKDLELQPEGSFEQVVELPAAGNPANLDGIRLFVVGGSFRPPFVEVGGVRRLVAIPLRPATFSAFRPNFEHLLDDPLARLRQSIEKRSPSHVLTASALVPEAERRAAAEALVAGFGADVRLDLALCAALGHLTGVNLGPDPELWREWWGRAKDRWFEAAPGRPAPGTPAFPPDAAAPEGPAAADR